MSHLSLAGSKDDFLHGINGEASYILGSKEVIGGEAAWLYMFRH